MKKTGAILIAVVMVGWLSFGLFAFEKNKITPVTCIKNNEMFYLDNYEIEYNYVIDNTKRAVYTDCYFYDLKMADKIKDSMIRP